MGLNNSCGCWQKSGDPVHYLCMGQWWEHLAIIGHRAIRIQPAHHGCSTEAEIRDILKRAAKPEGRVKLGSLLASIAREVGGLTNQEHALFERARIESAARAVSFKWSCSTTTTKHSAIDNTHQKISGFGKADILHQMLHLPKWF